VAVAGSEPTGPAPRPRGASRLVELTARLRGFGRHHRAPITIVGSLATAAALVLLLAGRRDEFATALSEATMGVLAVAALLQIVALLARSEAWHLTIEAPGGTVNRRVLYRASAMQVLGSVINGQLGVAARIAALRRSSPEVSPQVPTLIAAEFPILAVEATLAALASYTLVRPLGLPWWLPLIGLALVGTVSAGLRHLARRTGRGLWKGLTVLRRLRGGGRVVGFALVAVRRLRAYDTPRGDGSRVRMPAAGRLHRRDRSRQRRGDARPDEDVRWDPGRRHPERTPCRCPRGRRKRSRLVT